MKSSKLMCRSIALLTVLTITAAMHVQDVQVQPSKHHHYQLAQIPTLGGPGVNFFDNTNNIAVLNALGTVSGGATDTLIPDPLTNPKPASPPLSLFQTRTTFDSCSSLKRMSFACLSRHV